jgi:arylsulfatase A-like enzyme
VASKDDYNFDQVKRYMTTNDKPYCLFIMSINPHKPWDQGDPSEFNPAKIVLPPNMVDTKETRKDYCRYLAEIRRLDNQVGDIMELLRETGQEQNTIVIFLGEQGPQFAGGKWTCWDYGQKSSMIIRWPGQLKPKSTTKAFAQYEDITPTLIDIAGGEPMSDLDGKSLLPVIRDSSKSIRNYVYGIYNNIPEGPSYPSRSVRDKQYKLIVNLSPQNTYSIKWYEGSGDVWSTWKEKAKTDHWANFLVNRVSKRPALEFYDMINDPYELKNLADIPKYKKQIANHQLMLDKWMVQQGDKGAEVDRVYPK